jgi:hypothetical protein
LVHRDKLVRDKKLREISAMREKSQLRGVKSTCACPDSKTETQEMSRQIVDREKFSHPAAFSSWDDSISIAPLLMEGPPMPSSLGKHS